MGVVAKGEGREAGVGFQVGGRLDPLDHRGPVGRERGHDPEGV
ncbi:MAG: hypothetical protein WEA36_01115 [Balneolaceae bacterium]